MSVTCPTCARECADSEEYCLRCRSQLFVGPASAPSPLAPEDEPLGLGARVFIWLMLFAVGALAGLLSTP